MSGVCPNGSTHTVYRLHDYWAGRPKESDAYRRLGPPDIPQAQYGIAVGLVGAGMLALFAGGTTILLGLLLIGGGTTSGAVTKRKVDEAIAARERWQADFYCVTCPERFSPGLGK